MKVEKVNIFLQEADKRVSTTIPINQNKVKKLALYLMIW